MATKDASDPEDKGQQGAFNPETGEFNWDCSCLGGMAHGPCGEEFKSAFSCFMLSNDEPKGMNCIDHFKYVDHPSIHMHVPATDATPG
jgi:intermembrane space import and assembly protein 40